MQTFAIGLHHTQGDALGYVLIAPSGRALNACAYSLIQLTKLELERSMHYYIYIKVYIIIYTKSANSAPPYTMICAQNFAFCPI